METEKQTELMQPSTASLNLAALPDRLTDNQLRELVALLSEPLPPAEPCDDQHFAKCFRLMSAVLPKQSKDELAGKLFVAAYQRILQSYPKDAISYLTEQAMNRCRWFPTIAECIDILQEWRRMDDHTRKRSYIRQAIHREQEARRLEASQKNRLTRAMTAEEVAALPAPMIALGISCGALKRLDDGTVIYNEGE